MDEETPGWHDRGIPNSRVVRTLRGPTKRDGEFNSILGKSQSERRRTSPDKIRQNFAATGAYTDVSFSMY